MQFILILCLFSLPIAPSDNAAEIMNLVSLLPDADYLTLSITQVAVIKETEFYNNVPGLQDSLPYAEYLPERSARHVQLSVRATLYNIRRIHSELQRKAENTQAPRPTPPGVEEQLVLLRTDGLMLSDLAGEEGSPIALESRRVENHSVYSYRRTDRSVVYLMQLDNDTVAASGSIDLLGKIIQVSAQQRPSFIENRNFELVEKYYISAHIVTFAFYEPIHARRIQRLEARNSEVQVIDAYRKKSIESPIYTIVSAQYDDQFFTQHIRQMFVDEEQAKAFFEAHGYAELARQSTNESGLTNQVIHDGTMIIRIITADSHAFQAVRRESERAKRQDEDGRP